MARLYCISDFTNVFFPQNYVLYVGTSHTNTQILSVISDCGNTFDGSKNLHQLIGVYN